VAQYGDVSNVPDYLTAVSVVQRADEMFRALPSVLRSRFDNSPAQYLKFVSDPKNRDEAIALGMCKADAVPSPAPGSPGPTNPKPADPPSVDPKKV